MVASSDRSLPRPTPLEWLCLAAGLFLTLRYAWFLDDAFVYYRYVDNLLFLGRGLVFNEGEYVEGCSSPAWTLLLIPPRALGLNYWLIVRAVGLLSSGAFWWLLVRLRAATVPAGEPVLSFPLLYLSVNYAVASYFTSGMETPLVQVLAAAYALHVFRPGLLTPRILVALSPLVRHELALPLLLALAWAWWRERRFPRLTAALAAVTTGGWLLFRIWYYADLFPNTFYLKDAVRLDWGLAYLHDTLLPYGGYLVAAAALVGALLLARKRVAFDLAPRLVLLAMALGVAAYVVKIGGDGRHYRYLAFPFCAAIGATSGLPERLLALRGTRLRPAGVATIGALLLLASALALPRQLDGHPLWTEAREERVGVIRDAQYHRLKPDLAFSPWSSGAEMEGLTPKEADFLYENNGEPPPGHGVDLRDEYARYLAEIRPHRSPATRPDSWCVTIWKRFNERILHHDGLTEPVLAHARIEPWRPGHYKGVADQLALDLSRIQTEYGWGRGTYRKAVEDGAAPEWVERNLEALELIERKVYNRHDLLENVVLAFTRVPRIEPGAAKNDTAGD